MKVGYVNVYELDDEIIKRMKSLIFERPTEEWVDFVMKNRTERGFTHDYDIVYGPVADDSVYTQFTLYEGGIISMSTLIQELKPINWLISIFSIRRNRCLPLNLLNPKK